MKPFIDERLDRWVESRLLKRSRDSRYAVPKWTRYTSKALLLMCDLEMPFELRRREDLKFEFSIFGVTELANSYEELAPVICQVLYRVVEGTRWPHNEESNHAEVNR